MGNGPLLQLIFKGCVKDYCRFIKNGFFGRIVAFIQKMTKTLVAGGTMQDPPGHWRPLKKSNYDNTVNTLQLKVRFDFFSAFCIALRSHEPPAEKERNECKSTTEFNRAFNKRY
ncbi:hypothetical protein EBO34_00125 [Alteribacter keqinensis]|uniref:Uncharacterized protein n=1 Tax=Alteribacter keqinensis TaxID=2483800 RepID=A0A3M7TSK6_9BACI|nr:hypothetical protein EBO34_00125 [Alteribacter keqinensis]